MSRGARSAALLIFAVGVLLVAPAGNASAVGWLPPVNVSPALPSPAKFDVLSLQDVAVDGQGNAVAVWVQSDGGPEVVEAATRPLGGAWSSPAPVSEVGEEVFGLKVVVDPQGDAAAIWMGVGVGNTQTVRAATRPAGGDWTEPVALSNVGEYAHEPDIAIDAESTVTAVWTEGEVGDYGVVQAATRPAGDDWSAPVELSDGKAAEPQVAVDLEGDVTAVWTLIAAGRGDGIVQSKTHPAGGEWSSVAVDVSGADGLAEHPRLAVGPQGDATVVWQRRDIPAASGFKQFVQTARRVAGTWSTPVTLSGDGELAGNPAVTVDPQDNATAIYVSGLTGTATRFVQTRSRAADGSWGSPVNLVVKNGLVEPGEGDLQVEADPQGSVTAIWTAWASPNMVVRSARRALGGAWSTPVDVSAAAAYSLFPQTAVDPQGYATVVWSGFQGSTQAVRSRVLDPVAPELRDLMVPVSGVVGQPVAMSVNPFDLWPPVTTAWSFGDGGTGADASVSHCYSSPGVRTVTVTGTDQAANATSVSRTISIEPDPALAPGSALCGGPGPGPGPGPGRGPDPRPGSNPGPGSDPLAPVVSGLRQSSSSWRTRAADRRPRLPVGTTFRFRLNRAADVRLAFSQVIPGRRATARCVAPTRANRNAPRCSRHQARGTLEMAGEPGANAHGFQGRIGGRTLAPGRYRLLVTARADGRASAPASIGFTIAR